MDQQIWIIAPQGRVDAASAPDLSGTETADRRRRDVDRRGFLATRYMSSNGLRALPAALKET